MIKPGDRVTAFGNRGTVKRISENGMFLVVGFDGTNNDMIFYRDGKMFQWNKKPVLKLIKGKK
jgi:hypothetical protein